MGSKMCQMIFALIVKWASRNFFAGCILGTSKDNLKALFGLVVLAPIVSIWLDGNAKGHYLWQLRVLTVHKEQSFPVTLFVLTLTGSSKFRERQSVDDNFNDCIEDYWLWEAKKKKEQHVREKRWMFLLFVCFFLYSRIFHSLFDENL